MWIPSKLMLERRAFCATREREPLKPCESESLISFPCPHPTRILFILKFYVAFVKTPNQKKQDTGGGPL